MALTIEERVKMLLADIDELLGMDALETVKGFQRSILREVANQRAKLDHPFRTLAVNATQSRAATLNALVCLMECRENQATAEEEQRTFARTLNGYR